MLAADSPIRAAHNLNAALQSEKVQFSIAIPKKMTKIKDAKGKSLFTKTISDNESHHEKGRIHHDRYGDLLGGHADRLPGFAVPQGAQDDESRLMTRSGRSAHA